MDKEEKYENGGYRTDNGSVVEFEFAEAQDGRVVIVRDGKIEEL